jgi:hypothetical protein
MRSTVMKTVHPTPPGKYLSEKYACNKGHGGNRRLIASRHAGRVWLQCVGCQTFFTPEELPRLLRNRIS